VYQTGSTHDAPTGTAHEIRWWRCMKLVALRINRCLQSGCQFQKGWWHL